jgi:tetratricopeptide (TPR) repeat protein
MKYPAGLGAALAVMLTVMSAGGQAAAQPAPAKPNFKPLTLASPALHLPPAAVATAAHCNPYAAMLAKGEAANAANQYDAALAIADGILKRAPDDFQANFFKGKMLYLKAAASDPNRWSPPLPLSATMAEGFDLLIKTAGRLPQIDQACVASTNPYSILNTIGAFYLNRGYFKEAQAYLLKAYGALDKVPTDSKRKICDNLGLVYLVQLQPDIASRYYTEAIRYGSKVGPAQIRKAQGLKTTFFALPAK